MRGFERVWGGARKPLLRGCPDYTEGSPGPQGGRGDRQGGPAAEGRRVGPSQACPRVELSDLK